MLQDTQDLLQGAAFDSLAQYRARQGEVKKGRDFADAWHEAALEILKLDVLASELAEEDREPVTNKLNEGWLALWEAPSEEEIATEGSLRAIKDARDAIREKQAIRPGVTAMTLAPSSLMSVVSPAMISHFDLPRSVAAAESVPEIDYEASARDYRDRLKRSRWAVVAVAFAIAVFTGLIALYFGKTWGTPTDYLTAFLWGLTTQAALTGLLAVLAPDSNPIAIPSAPVGTKSPPSSLVA